MRWTGSQFIRNALQALLGPSHGEVSETALRIEEIRQAMLDCLMEYAGTRHYPRIERRIVFARDMHSLWYLRGDILAMMALFHGEIMARRKIQQITAMFEGFLPDSLFAHHPSLEH